MPVCPDSPGTVGPPTPNTAFPRRVAVQSALSLAAGSVLAFTTSTYTQAAPSGAKGHGKMASPPPFKISLAQWSLHKAFKSKQLDPLNFATLANGYGFDAIEYVNQLYEGKATDKAYLAQLKRRAADHGVWSVLIMIDHEGDLGAAEPSERQKAVENHKKWVDAAAFLGCHAIRVNAHSRGSYAEQVKLAADGLRRLATYADPMGINVIVENHGGLSSNGAWLAEVMKAADHPRCGTLPDFGNFKIADGQEYDRYKGVEEMMPFAKSVSAKAFDFDKRGQETKIDFARMMKIVTDASYHGYVGIEYEGDRLGEEAGILATKRLLEKVRDNLWRAQKV